MINRLPPFQGLNIRIPVITPIEGRGFMNQGSSLLPLLRPPTVGNGPKPAKGANWLLGFRYILMSTFKILARLSSYTWVSSDNRVLVTPESKSSRMAVLQLLEGPYYMSTKFSQY